MRVYLHYTAAVASLEMNYGDTGFPWDPDTFPQVCVSLSSPRSTLSFSSSPGSVRCRGRRSLRRSRWVCPGSGPREERCAGTAQHEPCSRDWFSFCHMAVKIHPRKNFGFFLPLLWDSPGWAAPVVPVVLLAAGSCSPQRCTVHGISVSVLFSRPKFTTQQPELFKMGKLPNLYHFTFLC